MNLKKLTIYNLRKDFGYKVKVNHFRYLNSHGPDALFSMSEIRNQKSQDDINPNGGLTRIEITDKKGETCTIEAKCHEKDPFNRKIAIQICLGRYLKKIYSQD